MQNSCCVKMSAGKTKEIKTVFLPSAVYTFSLNTCVEVESFPMLLVIIPHVGLLFFLILEIFDLVTQIF